MCFALFHSFWLLNSYHKNSLSKEQLEAIAAELQKKVKVLQQRHRRHLEKLVGLENTVNQLRQSNLLNEERLQLLERVFKLLLLVLLGFFPSTQYFLYFPFRHTYRPVLRCRIPVRL